MSNYIQLFSATTIGVDGFMISVETDLQNGLPRFEITGLADSTIREAKERVRSAIINSGFEFPIGRIVVNLAPADIRKDGTGFDLVIAIAILISSKQINLSCYSLLNNSLIAGELSLDGSVRSIRGALPIAEAAKNNQKKYIVLPHKNTTETMLLKDIEVVGVDSLNELAQWFEGNYIPKINMLEYDNSQIIIEQLDFTDIHGQNHAKRGMLICACGGHHVMMVGPPGTGKSMLAKRLPFIMPELNEQEKLEVLKIQSVSGLLQNNNINYSNTRPYRAPHHSITTAGLIGGMNPPRPGEITLAHKGVLFLDELTEFARKDLEMLRQPLEDGDVVIVRGGSNVRFPGEIVLIAAMNPCFCGFFFSKSRECSCKEWERKKYINRISGPFRDRFDLQIEVSELALDEIEHINNLNKDNNTTDQIYNNNNMKQIVGDTRSIQIKRQNTLNSKLSAKNIKKYAQLSSDAQELLNSAYKQLHLSMRGYHKILKVARTIADMEKSELITANHIAEAISYRAIEKYYE